MASAQKRAGHEADHQRCHAGDYNRNLVHGNTRVDFTLEARGIVTVCLRL